MSDHEPNPQHSLPADPGRATSAGRPRWPRCGERCPTECGMARGRGMDVRCHRTCGGSRHVVLDSAGHPHPPVPDRAPAAGRTRVRCQRIQPDPDRPPADRLAPSAPCRTSGFTRASRGPEGDRQRGVLDDVREGDELRRSECLTIGEPSRSRRPTERPSRPPRSSWIRPATSESSSRWSVPAGAQSTAKQVGQIPANVHRGGSTIVSGTTANKRSKAALAPTPGGVVDPRCPAEQRRVRGPHHRRHWPHTSSSTRTSRSSAPTSVREGSRSSSVRWAGRSVR